jgi:hypothetical protein
MDFKNTSMIELAVVVAQHLKHKDIRVVLVGGLAVEIYTENQYLTNDIDMVDISYQKPAVLRAAMLELGFTKQGRVYRNSSTDIVMEFPSAPLAVGDELIKEQTNIETEFGEIPILFAVDVIKDRLAAYLHWKDQQSLIQALCIMLCHKIVPKEIKAFYENEASEEAFEKLQDMHSALKRKKLSKMPDIEKYVVEQLLKAL